MARKGSQQPRVEAFIRRAPRGLRGALRTLRQIVRETLPEAREEIKWGRPVYSLRRIVCYLASGPDYVGLGFYRGTDLRDPRGLLEGDGKRLRHLRVRSAAEIRPRLIAGLLRQASKLDDD